VVLLHARTAQLEERAQQLCSSLVDSFERNAAALQRSKLTGAGGLGAGAAGAGEAAAAAAAGERGSEQDLVMAEAGAGAGGGAGGEGQQVEGEEDVSHAVAQVRGCAGSAGCAG
jgi:hypothetical protein